ncbi:MAG: MogA/MoaB family molybdenum cofactor biosynthesis protein [Spirochaetaceae bacterium]|nr:MAG: MogA/MoaB family molybdenum cofactor biosynthesis protein [Spirochaetaceae bacterium]
MSVITISDRASRGEYEDRSGPEIVSILCQAFPAAEVRTEVVPDEAEAIVAAFKRNRHSDFILTTGGTGISARDVTPETTRGYCDRELPGIAEVLRTESYRETPTAVLSRGSAGIKGSTIIVNFPGSVKAVRLCTRVLIPVMEHALSMLRGEGH